MVASNLDNVLSIEIRMCVRRQKTFSNVRLLCTRSASFALVVCRTGELRYG
jgi:hypothetical protein